MFYSKIGFSFLVPMALCIRNPRWCLQKNVSLNDSVADSEGKSEIRDPKRIAQYPNAFNMTKQYQYQYQYQDQAQDNKKAKKKKI